MFFKTGAGRLGQEPWTVKQGLADLLLPSVSIRRVSCASKSDKSDTDQGLKVTVICNYNVHEFTIENMTDQGSIDIINMT